MENLLPSAVGMSIRVLVVALFTISGCYDLGVDKPKDAGGTDSDSDTDADSDAELCPGGVLDGDHAVEQAADLDPIDGCQEITGTLDISCPDCTSLSPLGSLTAVGGNLLIEDCDQLVDVNGLSALLSVGGQLRLQDNDGLENVDGLANVCIEGTLTVIDNTDLTTCMACELLYHLQDDCDWSGAWTVSGNLPDSCGSTC